MKRTTIILAFTFIIGLMHLSAATFSGTVKDEGGLALCNVFVFVVEDNVTYTSDEKGRWTITTSDDKARTLVFKKEAFTYEQLINQQPEVNLCVVLREAVKSAASVREDSYLINGCNSISIPDEPKWNISFNHTDLKGDLAPDPEYIRRDPSAVIKANGKYYVYYSYSLTLDPDKIAPWDLNDIYYSTSKDGWTWEEQGLAVGRGAEGSFDARSVFTTEVLAHDGKYYLVYQAAADEDGIYNRNTVAMSVADSPDGPWTKLDEPVLHPTYTSNLFFDNNAVHDPCIVPYQGKFHLYYKGECNCMGANGCIRWCNPICGLRKQVKWGVAIADKPTGPYKKSVHNPVTNTGHEVMVWPYKDGMAILQHQDGPEAKSIQYSKDGFNFELKGMVDHIPEAAGLYRSETSDSDPHAGVSWGVAHVLKWERNRKGWMYLRRFDKVTK